MQAAENLGFDHPFYLEEQLGIWVTTVGNCEKEHSMPSQWLEFFQKLAGPYGKVIWEAHKVRHEQTNKLL